MGIADTRLMNTWRNPTRNYMKTNIKKSNIEQILSGNNQKMKLVLWAEEINLVIKNVELKKSLEHDKITNEHNEIGDSKLLKNLTEIFNQILKTGIISEKWKRSDIIIPFKKRRSPQIENYCPITSSRTFSFSPMLSKIDCNQFWTTTKRTSWLL